MWNPRVTLLTGSVLALGSVACLGWHADITELGFDDQIDRAAFVGVVEIEDRERIEINDLPCGATYTARVIEHLKGPHRRVVFFGRTGWRELAPGETYFAVLFSDVVSMEFDDHWVRRIEDCYRNGGDTYFGDRPLTLSRFDVAAQKIISPGYGTMIGGSSIDRHLHFTPDGALTETFEWSRVKQHLATHHGLPER